LPPIPWRRISGAGSPTLGISDMMFPPSSPTPRGSASLGRGRLRRARWSAALPSSPERRPASLEALVAAPPILGCSRDAPRVEGMPEAVAKSGLAYRVMVHDNPAARLPHQANQVVDAALHRLAPELSL